MRSLKINVNPAQMGAIYRNLAQTLPAHMHRAVTNMAAQAPRIMRHSVTTVRPHTPVYTGKYMWAWKARPHDSRPENPSIEVYNDDMPVAAVVEYGRRPGKMPPSSALVPWVKAKIRAPHGKGKGAKKHARKSARKAIAKNRSANRVRRRRGILKTIKRLAKGSIRRSRSVIHKSMKWARRTTAKRLAKMLKRPGARLKILGRPVTDKEAKGIAFAIARAIAKRGLKPKKVLERALPKLQKALMTQVEKGLNDAVAQAASMVPK